MDESSEHRASRFKIGQLVCLRFSLFSLSVGESIELKFENDVNSQSVYLKEGTLALILAANEPENYKVLVGDLIGWVDLFDVSNI